MGQSVRAHGANEKRVRPPSRRLRPNGGDRRVEFRRGDRRADRALGRPMGARADRLDPLARMGMSEKAVRFEPERMQGVPEPAIDELQECELRRGQDAAPRARRVQDRHQARRGEVMRVHDLDGPDGCLGLRQNPIGDGERLGIEGERFVGTVAARRSCRRASPRTGDREGPPPLRAAQRHAGRRPPACSAPSARPPERPFHSAPNWRTSSRLALASSKRPSRCAYLAIHSET